MEVWAGRVPDDLRICTKGGLVLQTPNLAPTYQALSLCPAPVPELTLQVMGVGECSDESPYVKRLGLVLVKQVMSGMTYMC